MSQMAVQELVDAGTDPTKSAANLNDTAAVGNGHNTFLDIVNTGISTTVTITNYQTLADGTQAPPHVVTVAATTGHAKIMLRQAYDKGDGTGAQIAYSQVTGVTSALVQVT